MMKKNNARKPASAGPYGPVELLSPAGSMESLKAAVLYGADAVYLGGEAFGLRAKARNFDRTAMQKASALCREHGVKVYVTLNILARNDQVEAFPEYLSFLQEAGVDGVIESDPGLIALTRRLCPDLPIHLSTQASCMNYESFRFFHELGVSRIVAARELSLAEIRKIREKTPDDLQIEAFVHGAMCMSVSGRCLISNYLSGRDSNQGLCAHPCRWQYALMEEKRPGEYFPVVEDETGTYFFNSKDLCMVDHLPEMISSGITSLKIEGRMKTPLYVAMVTSCYRSALQDLSQGERVYRAQIPSYLEKLSMVSHRGYTTGFYLHRPGPEDQNYASSDYEKSIEMAGIVLDPSDLSSALVEQRSKFRAGDTLFLLETSGKLVPFEVTGLKSEQGETIESAPHALEKVRMRLPKGAQAGCVLARICAQNQTI